LWLHSLKVAQLLRSAACLHTNQSRSYLNHLVSTELFNALTSTYYTLRLCSPTYPDNDSRLPRYPGGIWFVTSNKLEIFALLVCYAAQVGISYRRFGTTRRSDLQGPITWTLKVGPAGCPETTNIRSVTSQSKDDIIYTASEAWNQALNLY